MRLGLQAESVAWAHVWQRLGKGLIELLCGARAGPKITLFDQAFFCSAGSILGVETVAC